MRVWSALLITLFMAAASEAQIRGMGINGRARISSIPPVVSPVPPVLRPNIGINPGFRQGLIPGFGYGYGSGFGPGFGIYPSGAPVIAAPYPYYYPYYYPFNPYGPYPDYPLPSPITSYYQETIPYTPSPDLIINDLTGQVQQLTDEVQQLRDELSVVSTTPAPPPPEAAAESPERPSSPIILIFRDGRRLETQGYVIAGQTIWIVGDDGPLSFELSDLNVERTRAENLKRGIRFMP
jgi:hypothetical protein